MNTFRSLVFVFVMYPAMAVFAIVMLPTMLLPKRFAIYGVRLYAAFVRIALQVICGVKTEFRGLEHLPTGAIIYAGKHHCTWDVFVPFLIVKAPAIIMKRELMWYPFLGWYALKANMIAIDRAGAAKTMRQILSAAKNRIARGRQILIFPEGTRVKPGDAPDYKAAGIGGLYKALDVPCVPVATNAGLCWPANGLTRTPGTIVYEVLEPIAPGLDRRTLMTDLQTRLEAASNRLIAEELDKRASHGK